MRLTEKDLAWAVSEKIFSKQATNKFLRALRQHKITRQSCDLVHTLYYVGAILVVMTLAFFFPLFWKHLGSAGLIAVSGLTSLLFFALGSALWKRKGWKTPGSLFIVLALCAVPLLVFGIELHWGIWPAESWSSGWLHPILYTAPRIGITLTTLIVGLLTLYVFRIPLLTLPLLIALWFFGRDVSALILSVDLFSLKGAMEFSVWFGLVTLGISGIVDRIATRDYASRLYFFGLLSYWLGVTVLASSTLGSQLIYLSINIILVLLSVILHRRVFAIFGAMGLLYYFTQITNLMTRHPVAMSFGIVGLGLLFLFAGMLMHRHQELAK